ncbi:MAG TPA: DUF2808 domain-containing protein [Leptolyngbyaceae cyanobacterium M33_DOE_097]|uniref:DUF2808 domain-containing protein n=1 Tax=Oscillatoriales cyanobacterium SpSt-418 TaxID=2282169 RepID=A0A7C3PJS4_9CYAN|nr:DUF2808 domain-containing protein [Leptolyngbyaceae cyanobacterium M33_DOE_097]
MLLNSFAKRTLRGLAIATALCASVVPAVSLAQGGSGLVIFSGVERENILDYHLDFGGRRGQYDRYRLRVPQRKVKLAVNQINISYPDYYKGTFDPKNVEVFIQGDRKKVGIKEVVWNKQNYLLEIYLTEAIPANNRFEIHLNNVVNPDFGGTFYFNVLTVSPGDVPLPRQLGTWVITIS